MHALINPGSGGVPASGTGWTNTYDRAEQIAREWLARMREDGQADIELVPPSDQCDTDGRWTFVFRHTVTGIAAELTTHGIDNWTAYERERTFLPRTYWNGSSCSEPRLDDWSAPGFEKHASFVPATNPTKEG